MSIPGFTEAQLAEVLSDHLTPSQVIMDPDRLLGRERYLTQIRRALLSPGRHVFIHGERGIGKTSLAVTAGRLAVAEDNCFIYVPCGEQTSFFEVLEAIGNNVTQIGRIGSRGARGLTLGLNIPGLGGANVATSSGPTEGVAKPNTMSEAIDLLRFVRSKLQGQIVIAVDELDRVKREEKTYFAELLKNVSTQIEDMRFVFCGIGANVSEILGEHLSSGRMFEPVEVEKLSYDKLWQIISDATVPLNVEIPRGFLMRIGIISDGFPHYVHLLGECLLYAMHDDPEPAPRCERGHFDIALREALQKAEPSLRSIYSMATQKTKNHQDYEEALWALADRTATKRQLSDIEQSYARISQERRERSADPEERARPILRREKLNDRLLTLRKDSHANILLGWGSGWFSFRENVVRGYVRMKAESEGVELVPELTT